MRKLYCLKHRLTKILGKVGGGTNMQQLGNLSTEQINKRTRKIDLCNTIDILKRINDEDKKVSYAVRKEIHNIATVVDMITDRLKEGGRLFYVGAGTSGRLGVLDASECPPTFGTAHDMVQGIMAGGTEAMYKAFEGIEDNERLGRACILEKNVNGRDVVVGITASGRTPFVMSAIREAKKAGAITIGISNCTNSRIRKEADYAVTPLVGPEVIMGSTRMKSGTSQKLVLNMISTAVMIKLGKVYMNLMVDLKPTNEKLMNRAIRIIMHATGIEYGKAEEVLKTSKLNLKAAIIIIKTGVNLEFAERLLEQADGFVSKALEIFSQKQIMDRRNQKTL
jgi:N-acetylmuramic acid 6-phosphate etherase